MGRALLDIADRARAVASVAALALLGGAALGGCDTRDPLPEYGVIEGLRVLGVRADPPEVAPGESFTLDALVVDPLGREVTYEWAVCLPPLDDLLGAFFPTGDDVDSGAVPDYDVEDCVLRLDNGADDAESLGTGATASYAVPEAFFEDLSVVAESLGLLDDELSEADLTLIAGIVGIDLYVSLRVTAGGTSIRALKRVKVSTASTPNANPPGIPLWMRDRESVTFTEVDGVEEPDPMPDDAILPEPGRCLVAFPDGIPTVAPGVESVLHPVAVPEPESYQLLVPAESPDAALPFDFLDVEETLTLSWFTTAPGLASEQSRIFADDEDEDEDGAGGGGDDDGPFGGDGDGDGLRRAFPGSMRWTPAVADGAESAPLWVVIRDGRGGTSWCVEDVVIAR